MEIPKTASGVAKKATEEDIARDEHGFTNPNLHRRVEPVQPTDPAEVAPRTDVIGVYDKLHSYRTTQVYYHDEESTTCEIP